MIDFLLAIAGTVGGALILAVLVGYVVAAILIATKSD